jgi:ABC-2 type transport system ATP-binding protein
MEEQILLQAVTKVFKNFWGNPKVTAVRDLSFTVEKGKIFGLLGPNGSGKSTTLKLILGLLYPTKGRITVLGKNPGDNFVKRIISYLPEQDYLYPYLDARETLDFYGKIFNLSSRERRKRIDYLIELLGMKGYERRAVSEYSKGMTRRIGLAQALINDPDLLIFDEPTSGMDPIGNAEIKNVFLDLKEKGKTILISSHLLAHIESICDNIGFLYQGELIGLGEVDTLLAPYKHENHPLEKYFINLVEQEKKKRMEKSEQSDLSEKEKEQKKEPEKKNDGVNREVLQNLIGRKKR